MDYLYEHTRSFPSFQYVVRYRPRMVPEDAESAEVAPSRGTPLTGYGVEMALKKTDYLVVDDRVTGSSEQKTFQAARNASNPFLQQLGEDPWAETATPLTEEEIASE